MSLSSSHTVDTKQPVTAVPATSVLPSPSRSPNHLSHGPEDLSPLASDLTSTSLFPSPFDVRNLVVVITGGGTGLGLLMAKTLEHNGAIVYIVGRRFDVLERAAQENNRFQNLIPHECDVSKRESLLVLVETITTRHGYIDLLINNAGVAANMYPHPLPGPSDSPSLLFSDSRPISPPYSPSNKPTQPSITAFQEALWNCGTPEDFDQVFRTNVTGVYYTTIAFLELLHRGNLRRLSQERSSQSFSPNTTNQFRPPYWASQVLSVSSSGSFRRDAHVLSPSYTLSKVACTHLGKMLTSLLQPWGIRSNVLAPGVWPTAMTTNPTPNHTMSPEDMARNVPLQRVGSEEDIAGTILFLASRAGAYMNGSILLNDGGRVGTVASTY